MLRTAAFAATARWAGAARAGDLALLDSRRAFSLDFSDGPAADRPAGLKPTAQRGEFAIDPGGFHHGAFRAGEEAEVACTVPLAAGQAA